MNLIVIGYIIYMPGTLLLIHWVARTLFKIVKCLSWAFLEEEHT